MFRGVELTVVPRSRHIALHCGRVNGFVSVAVMEERSRECKRQGSYPAPYGGYQYGILYSFCWDWFPDAASNERS